MGKQYHYERLRCVDLRRGGATKGPFKKYKTAESERRFTVNMFGGHWNIERFRVYDN